MSPNDVFTFYDKNWSKVSRELKLGKNTTSYWRKVGYIPMPMQLKIQQRTNGELIADINKQQE